MKKRIFAAVLSVLMLLSLCACTAPDDSDASNGKTKISFSYWNSEETVKPLLELLAEKLPDIEVEYTYVPNASYGTAISTKLISGSGDDLIAFSELSTMTMGKQGLIDDLTDRYSGLFSESGTAPYTIDGKLYAVPMLNWYEGYFYNKAIFAEHNLQIPTTFDEFVEVCEVLQSKGIKPLTIGAKDGATLLKSLLGYVQSEYILSEEGRGFDSKFSKGETTLDGNWNRYIAEWSVLIEKGIITTNDLGIDDNQALDEFATGKAAMWASGCWSYENIKQKNINMEFGMFPYLGAKPENASLVGSSAAGIAVNAKSKNKEAAYRVLDVICSPEGQRALIEGQPGSSSYLKGLESELPEEYDDVKDILEAGRVHCCWSNWGYATNCFNNFTQGLQGLVAHQIGISDMLKEVDRVAQSYARGDNE